MRFCTLLAMFSGQSVCLFSAGLFLQGVFSSKRTLPEVPPQPTLCHCIVLSRSGSHEARAVLEIRVSQKLKFVYL